VVVISDVYSQAIIREYQEGLLFIVENGGEASSASAEVVSNLS
jgi:hypothetical protein